MRISKNRLFINIFMMGVMLYYALRRTTIYTESFKVILLMAMVSGMVHILWNIKMTKGSFIRVGIFLVVTLIFYLLFSNLSVLILFVGMMTCLDSSPKDILKLAALYKFIFTVLFIVLGVGSKGNTLAIEIGVLILIYLYLKDNILNRNEYLILFIIYIAGSIITKSGSFIVVIAMMFMLSFIGRVAQGRKFLTGRFVQYIFPISFIGNIFWGLCVQDTQMPWIGRFFPDFFNEIIISIANFLDVIMSYRLALVKVSLKRFGYKFIGGTIDIESLNLDQYSYYYLDSGYVNLLQGWGVLFSVVFMILMVIIMSYLIKEKEYALIISGICLAFWAINEPILTYIDWNFLLLVCGKAITNIFNKRNSSYLKCK